MKSGQRFLALSVFFPLFFCAVQSYALPVRDAPAVKGPTRFFSDSSGRQVEVPAEIRRIIPSGPIAQMFLSAIAPDLLCALSVPLTLAEREFLPAGLASLPVAGQFYGQANFNPEEIARIAPDVIIDIGAPRENIANDMNNIYRATGTPVIHIAAELRDTPHAFRTLGLLLNREEKGEAIARFCEKTLGRADAVLEKAGSAKKTVLYCLGPQGLNVLARGSFHSEILDWMSDNLAAVDNPSSRATGNETNPEQILLWNPEIIIFESHTIYTGADRDPVWRQLRAIQNGSYYRIPDTPYNWLGAPPSVNRFLGILWLAKILYPQFADYDLYAECAEYFSLFYGYNLSRGRFEQLTGLQ